MDITAVWLIDTVSSFLQDCGMYFMSVISLFQHAESSPFSNSYYLFTLLFLSKQTRHGMNIVSLCSSCRMQKYLERWPAYLNEAGRSVLMLMKGPKIPRMELNTVHLYQHFSLFMHNKLQYTWRGD